MGDGDGGRPQIRLDLLVGGHRRQCRCGGACGEWKATRTQPGKRTGRPHSLTATDAERTTSVSHQLLQLSEQLEALVKQFKLSP